MPPFHLLEQQSSSLAQDAPAGAPPGLTQTPPLGAWTVSMAVLLVTPFMLAVMLLPPAETPVARPEMSIVATKESELFQVTELVRSWVPESL